MDSAPEQIHDHAENKDPNQQVPSKLAKGGSKEFIPNDIEESKASDLANNQSANDTNDVNSTKEESNAQEESLEASQLQAKQRSYIKEKTVSKQKKDRVRFKGTKEPLTERAANAAKRGATTMAAIAIGKSALHSSLSTMFSTCQVVLSSNKKKALSKVLPGVALALIPGVGLLAGIAMGIGSSYLGEKVYNEVLSSRTVGVDYRLFLPDALLGDLDDVISMLSVKIQQMSSPYYNCRDEILAAVLKAERTLDEDIAQKFEHVKFDINNVVIENETVAETVEKIMSVTKIVEDWFDEICNNLERLEEEIEVIVGEDEENLYEIQDHISERFDNLVDIMTREVPYALKDGLKKMDDTLKQVKV